jgi:hypothetical protein
MDEMEFEAGLVAGHSGVYLNQAKRLVEVYLPRVGEPLEIQKMAAEKAAKMADIFRRKAEYLANELGELDRADMAHQFSLAFEKISYLAGREVEIMTWRQNKAR